MKNFSVCSCIDRIRAQKVSPIVYTASRLQRTSDMEIQLNLEGDEVTHMNPLSLFLKKHLIFKQNLQISAHISDE